MWPQDGVIFGPRGIIKTQLVEVHKVMLHTKYQSSRRYMVSDKNVFIMFLPI